MLLIGIIIVLIELLIPYMVSISFVPFTSQSIRLLFLGISKRMFLSIIILAGAAILGGFTLILHDYKTENTQETFRCYICGKTSPNHKRDSATGQRFCKSCHTDYHNATNGCVS
jgi:hypothetical protein